jgi:hypothetical protein
MEMYTNLNAINKKHLCLVKRISQMKRQLSLLLISSFLLSGCQSLGDHFNCLAQVDRTVPAQTQQKYVKTVTNCSSSGGAIATPTTTRGDQYIVNNNSQTNCTSTPIYETIVLNQSQRDSAYQQCRNGVNNQRAIQQGQSYQYSGLSVGYQAPPSYSGQKMTIDQAISQCNSDGLRKGTSAYGDCVRKYSQQ